MRYRSLVTIVLLQLLLLGIGEGVLVNSKDNCTGQIVNSIGNYKPSSGNEYLVINIKIENNDDKAFPVSSSYFAVIADGNQYYSSYATYGLNNHIMDEELGKGNSIIGNIAFEVPQGSGNRYNLKYVGESGWNVIITNC